MAIIIFLVSFIPRILLLSKGPFHYDVVDYLFSMRDKVFTFHGSSFPLTSFLVIALGCLRDVFLARSNYLIVLQAATAVIASLACVVMYQVFKRLLDERSAIVYSLLVSFFPPFFSVTTFGRIDHALVILFAPLAVYFFLEGKPLFCALFTGLGIASRPETALILAGYLVVALFSCLRGRYLSLKEKIRCLWSEFIVILLISAAMVLLIALVVPEGKWFSRVVLRFIGKESSSDTALFLGFDAGRFFGGIIFMLRIVFIPVAAGLWWIIRPRSKDDFWKSRVLFVSLFVLSFFYLLNVQGASPRYFILPLFFLFFFSSQAIALPFKSKSAALSAGLLCSCLMLAPVIPIINQRHLHSNQVDFARHIMDITEPDSIIIAQDNEIFIRYYASRKIIIPPLSDKVLEWQKFRDAVLEVLKNKQPIYVASSAFSYDPYLLFRNYIQDNFLVQEGAGILNENWHGLEMEQHFYKERVFRIIPRITFKSSNYLF